MRYAWKSNHWALMLFLIEPGGIKADWGTIAAAKSVTTKRPKSRYLVGYGAKILVSLHAILPTRMFDKLIQKVV